MVTAGKVDRAMVVETGMTQIFNAYDQIMKIWKALNDLSKRIRELEDKQSSRM